MKLAIAYSLAPREQETINESIQSLRADGYKNKIYIFAEPGKYKIDDKNIELQINEKRLGAFSNYDSILQKMKNKSKYLVIIQDDYCIREGTIKEVNNIIDVDTTFGVYSLHLDRRNENHITREGWNNKKIGWNTVGACFLYRTEIIDAIRNNAFYQKHLNNYIKKSNQQIDACIGETIKQMDLPSYFPSYSYTKHIGEKSTLNHTDARLGIFYKKEFRKR